MNPLERAARALCELAGNPENATMDGKPLWMDYLPETRAVIEAIREPSEKMAKAGQKAAVVALHQDGGYRMQDTWAAMIDELLAESE